MIGDHLLYACGASLSVALLYKRMLGIGLECVGSADQCLPIRRYWPVPNLAVRAERESLIFRRNLGTDGNMLPVAVLDDARDAAMASDFRIFPHEFDGGVPVYQNQASDPIFPGCLANCKANFNSVVAAHLAGHAFPVIPVFFNRAIRPFVFEVESRLNLQEAVQRAGLCWLASQRS